MSFRSVLILFIFLSILSRSIAGLIILGWGSQIELPIIIYLFSVALILYGIGLLIYNEFKALSTFPLIIYFVSETFILIINLFVIHFYYTDKWYDVHIPFFDGVVTGNFLDLLLNLILVTYYLFVVRKRFWLEK